MSPDVSLVTAPDLDAHAALAPDGPTPVDQIGDAIAELAARLHAATYELLVLLQQFDSALGWNTGFLSCAQWLSWRTGIDPGAAREKVRVARALAGLPRISAAMQRGELSYSKVRALTRVATPACEAQLLDIARAGTAAQVELVVRAWHRADRQAAARLTVQRHLDRSVATWVDDDGMVIIRGRLTPEAGAVVQRAIEAAADWLYRESAQAQDARPAAAEVTAGQRRADALGRLAECALADLDRGTAGDRYQVVLHVEVPAATAAAAAGEPEAGQAVVELGHGATSVSAETSRRLACDASLVVMRHGADGSVLDVGRKTRTVPPAIRRALEARDRHCRFPGCTARRCDVHHVVHWAEGGATSLGNTLLVCRRHHRLVHEGGYTVVRAFDGTVTFVRPDGLPIDLAPAPSRWAGRDARPLGPTIDRMMAARCTVGPDTATPHGQGERLDVRWAIEVLRGHEAIRPPSGG